MQSKLFLIYLRHTHRKKIVQIVYFKCSTLYSVSKKEKAFQKHPYTKKMLFLLLHQFTCFYYVLKIHRYSESAFKCFIFYYNYYNALICRIYS